MRSATLAPLIFMAAAASASAVPRNNHSGGQSGYAVDPTPPPLDFLYEMYAETAQPLIITNTPSGTRAIYPIVGGSFKGPNVTGKFFRRMAVVWSI